LHVEHDKLREEYNQVKSEYNAKMKGDFHDRRILSKKIPVLTEAIFKRIRNR
jgi:hypothetical protein